MGLVKRKYIVLPGQPVPIQRPKLRICHHCKQIIRAHNWITEPQIGKQGLKGYRFWHLEHAPNLRDGQ